MHSIHGVSTGAFEMRILITGASGFIGGACVQVFIQNGWHVRTVSRNTPLEIQGVESFSECILNEVSDWAPYLYQVDVVLHLAGVAHQPRIDSCEYQRVNARATEVLALASLKAGVSRFLFLSSIAVYGHTVKEGAITEKTPTYPSNEYGQSKIDAELAIARIATGGTMSYVILQPPLVYGPNAPGNFRRLVQLVRTGIPLPLLAATSRRSYIALDNLSSAILCLATHPNAANEKFVISDDEDVSTAELINLIANALGYKARLWRVSESLLILGTYLIGRSADLNRMLKPMQIDASKIKSRLGWKPLISIEEGIKRALGS
jgi:nucleoside-diphosphate-sugar epimerase